MELHLHLSAAFRALDRKWGAPVDLDTTVDRLTCIPALVDRPTETFSSEKYLRTVTSRPARRKPYSRNHSQRRRDSFADISMARIPSESDFSAAYNEHSSNADDSDQNLGQAKFTSSETVNSSSGVQKKKKHIFKQLKNSAVSLVERRPWKKPKKLSCDL